MNDIERLRREAEKQRGRELEKELSELYEIRARLPYVVREAIEQVLDEADDLEHARELAGLEQEER